MSETSSTNELITTAMNGKNETRFLRIRFQLLPEVNNMRVDCARVRIILITPHRVQQPIAAERFRGIGYEVRQQRKLFRRQIDEFAAPSYFIVANIDLDIAEPVNLCYRGWWRYPSQHSF